MNKFNIKYSFYQIFYNTEILQIKLLIKLHIFKTKINYLKTNMSSPNLSNVIQQCMDRSNMDPQTFSQISRVFNIYVDNSFQGNQKILMQDKLKSKILDILHTEGQNYRDYLKLPKFNLLKPPAIQKLHSLFNSIWKRFLQQAQQHKKQKQTKQIQKLIPQFKTINQIQTFHLELLNEFKSSKLCQQKRSSDSKNAVQTNLFPTFDHSSIIPEAFDFKRHRDQNAYPIQVFKYNNFPINNNYFPKIQANQKFSVNQIWNDPRCMNNASSFPIPGYQDKQSNSFILEQKAKSNRAVQRPSYNQKKESMQDQNQKPLQNRVNFTGDQNQLLEKLFEYMFLQCACQGTVKDSPFMTCKNCKLSFHYKCLYIDQNYTQQLCPCCKLRQGSNIFLKIHPQPFAKRWCNNFKNQKLSFFLTEDQIVKMKNLRQNCKANSQIQYQLRFQKMIRKNPNSQPQPQESVNRARKFNSLPLPTDYIQKLKPNNMFQVNVKFQDDAQNLEDFMFFFAIFIVEKFSQHSMADQYFQNLNDQNSVGQQYLQNILTNSGGQSLTISLRDKSTQNIIQYPARGASCEHPEVFDYLCLLQVYRQYGERFKQLYCSECQNPIQRVVADKFLQDKIKEFARNEPQTVSDSIKYQGNGKVEFNPEGINDLESGSSQENNSNSDISGSVS